MLVRIRKENELVMNEEMSEIGGVLVALMLLNMLMIVVYGTATRLNPALEAVVEWVVAGRAWGVLRTLVAIVFFSGCVGYVVRQVWGANKRRKKDLIVVEVLGKKVKASRGDIEESSSDSTIGYREVVEILEEASREERGELGKELEEVVRVLRERRGEEISRTQDLAIREIVKYIKLRKHVNLRGERRYEKSLLGMLGVLRELLERKDEEEKEKILRELELECKTLRTLVELER